MRQRGALGWLKYDITHRGITAWMLSTVLLSYYLLLYWGGTSLFGVPIPDYVGFLATDLNWLLGIDTLTKWSVYGLSYTIAIIVGGAYVISKYRHNAYQIVRTGVVIFVQISLAFSIPEMLKIFDQPGLYLSYLWPLEISNFYPETLQGAPLYFAVWSIVGSLVVTPILGIFYGKRWYCSWVCGCGGLANTAGEPFRHLTPTSSRSWNFEKWAIHGTLVLALLTTGLVGASYVVGDQYPALQSAANSFQSWYGFIFVTMLSGILGVVLYPIGGTRVWCRNFCPMAAVLGLIQKFGRYHIRVKDDMCISCGMCSKYCEMGIDVRAYAQANEDFTRASCVGCGLCEEVCPRGVLHLENEWKQDPQELTMSGFLNEAYKS